MPTNQTLPTKPNHPKTKPNQDYNEARELLRPQQKWTTRRIGAATEGEVAAKMCKRDGEKEVRQWWGGGSGQHTQGVVSCVTSRA